MSVRGGTRNTKAPEREHFGADGLTGRSKYLLKTEARVNARQSAYDALPTNLKGGRKRPGSQNK